MSSKPQIRARVTFIPPEQNGRKTPAQSGTRADLMVKELFTTCVVHGSTNEQVFEFGIEYDVKLELLFWDQYKDQIKVGMPVQLNEGNRKVGFGTIDGILN